MIANAVDERLTDIFRSVLELDQEVDVRALRQEGSASWDSLGHMNLVMAMESEFGIEITISDAIEMTSYDAAARLVMERIASPERPSP